MKKTYMTPRSLAVEMNVESLICASPVYSINEEEQVEQWTNKREGGWSSDLWGTAEPED